MNFLTFKLTALTSCLLLLTACSQHSILQSAQSSQSLNLAEEQVDQPTPAKLHLQEIDIQDAKTEEVQWLNLSTWPQVNTLLSSKNKGLQFLDDQQNVVHQIQGQFGRFDYRIGPERLLIAASNLKEQQIQLMSMDLKSKVWEKPIFIPKRSFKSEDVCLYTDSQGLSFTFLVGEEGIGEQWLVANHEKAIEQPKLVRRLSFPPASNMCRVNDATAELLINEANIGVWAYPAHSEADMVRQAVDLVKPFGSIQGVPSAIAIVDDQVAVIDEEKPLLYRYKKQAKHWTALEPLQFDHVKEAKSLSIRGNLTDKSLLILDDKTIKTAQLEWQTQVLAKTENIITIPAEVETESVPSTGDAADDPAIWHNTTQPNQSRILATDKQGGLQVSDLQGKAVQYLAVGRLNNVDVRTGFKWGNQTVDLAVASNRDHNSLHIFAIHPKTGKVSTLGELPTTLDEIYGICMYRDTQGEIYAIPNDKNGTFIQYHITAVQQKVQAQEVQRFSVKTQPEGCAVDDATGRIFLGEEGAAVWVKDLNPKTQLPMQQVISVGNVMHADIEGIGLYHGKDKSYLVVSSQGNDSFVVLDATAPYTVRGVFRIGINTEKGIDAVSETDGLEVSSKDFGGKWKQGILVVQDGRKRMPEANQNFKYVPWEKIAQALHLD
ncbi:phytase [Acinetobacter pittii]|uniref:phytase n=1 Tax=Acinetobacter pittii TaxID=48296 RepID=UPI001EFDC405|nr:phytase [Acinetobacter pittii]MCG9494171.1 phytase [Acinetobacter pittii]